MLKTFHSKYNGKLELRQVQGKKVLDTRHTNFGYGSLDVLWKEIFQRFKIPPFKQSLILGVGAGNVIQRLRDVHDDGRIYAIDIDPIIIRIALKEFGLAKTADLEIQCTDADQYIRKTRRAFDIIVIDLFCDQTMPEFLNDLKFWSCAFKRIQPDGAILWNTNHTADDIKQIKRMARNMKMRVDVLKSKNNWNTVYRFRKL